MSIRCFMYSAGVLLLITGAAKLFSSFGTAGILQTPDPILGFTFRQVFRVVGLIELVVSVICFFRTRVDLQAALLASLAACFLVYRLGLFWLGYQKPCSCLGNPTENLHISPHAADVTMKCFAIYLLFGSCATLLNYYKVGRQVPSSTGAEAPSDAV
jgi:hypothetical protein